MIPQDFLDQVAARHDIVDVVDRRIKLKKAGRDYVACCPFHKEKSPSFTVSPSKQFYHCFGCGAHGGVVSFLMEHDGLGFVEAVEQLAGEVGLQVPQERRTAQSKSAEDTLSQLRAALEAAKTLFESNLPQVRRAAAYVSGRGITADTISRFGIGFATTGIAEALNIPVKVLLDAGLMAPNEDTGEVYDKFRQRVMFPILDERGRVIGFGGRVLDDGKPKYMNSPETALFSKGQELYGLYQAKTSIRQSRVAVVIEGYMDVVMAHQHGETRAVAALGTSVTEEQVQRLYRMADEIIFCFDGDAAGVKAANRAASLILPIILEGKRARFVTLPDEHDPDSFLREFGLAAWHDYLETNGVQLSRKLLQLVTARFDLSLPEDLSDAVRQAEEIVSQIVKAETYRVTMVQLFERALGVPLRSGKTQPGSAAVEAQRPRVVPVATSERLNLYRAYAGLLALSPEVAASVPDELIDDFACLIAGWFAVAPTTPDEAIKAAASLADKQLGEIVTNAIRRAERSRKALPAAALKREAMALHQLIIQSDVTAKRRASIAALLES